MQKKTYERVDWPCATVGPQAIYFNRHAVKLLPDIDYIRFRMTTDELIFEFHDRPLLMGEKLRRVVRRQNQMAVYKPIEIGARIKNGAYRLYASNGVFYIKRYETKGETHEQSDSEELLQVR